MFKHVSKELKNYSILAVTIVLFLVIGIVFVLIFARPNDYSSQTAASVYLIFTR